jgi:integrase
MKSIESLEIRSTLHRNGERLPILVDRLGMPLFFPSLFITSQVRNAAMSANTIRAYLSAIKRLCNWAQVKGIDLERRLSLRSYLTDSEIESMCSSLGSRIRSTSKKSLLDSELARLSKSRTKVPNGQILRDGKYRNLMYVTAYLRWLSNRLIERAAGSVDVQAKSDIESMVAAIDTRRPRKPRRSLITAKKGLEHTDEVRLLEVVNKAAVHGKSPAMLCRNELIIHLLDKLGIRAGELLSLKVTDFDFVGNQVLIARRPDDKADPRRNQPTAKTCDRLLPISNDLAKLTHDYIVKHRRLVKGAKRHAFLIVVHKEGPCEGMPLSPQGLSKIFLKLRVETGLHQLTPHTLRHTNNERYSELMDANGVSAAEEDKMRSYAMGWNEGSGTAATYTRRHVQRKAHAAARKLQESLSAPRKR